MSTPQEQVAAQLKALGIAVPAEGWEALDPTSPKHLEAKERDALERYHRAKVIADGVSAEALQVMWEMTVEAQSFNVPELGMVNAIGFGVWREGQNSLVRWIREQKRIAAQGPSGKASPTPRSKKSR